MPYLSNLGKTDLFFNWRYWLNLFVTQYSQFYRQHTHTPTHTFCLSLQWGPGFIATDGILDSWRCPSYCFSQKGRRPTYLVTCIHEGHTGESMSGKTGITDDRGGGGEGRGCNHGDVRTPKVRVIHGTSKLRHSKSDMSDEADSNGRGHKGSSD